MNLKHFGSLGLVIALSTSSMSLVFSILFLNIISIPLFICVFLATYAFYAIDRVMGIESDKISRPDRSEFFSVYRKEIYVTILLAIGGSISICAMISLRLALLVAISPLIALLYSFGLSGGRRRVRAFGIKGAPLLKDAFIAAGWAFLLPFTFLFLKSPIELEHWIFAVPLYLKLFVMAVIYDFKDIESDTETGVRTLPIIIGESRAKTVLHILNVVATVLIIIMVGLAMVPILGLIFIPAFFYQGLNIYLLHKDAPDWVYYVLADLEQFFWLIFIIIGGVMLGSV